MTQHVNEYIELLDRHDLLIDGEWYLQRNELVHQMDWIFPKLTKIEESIIVQHQTKIYLERIAR